MVQTAAAKLKPAFRISPPHDEIFVTLLRQSYQKDEWRNQRIRPMLLVASVYSSVQLPVGSLLSQEAGVVWCKCPH
jgi:hypothetical protein